MDGISEEYCVDQAAAGHDRVGVFQFAAHVTAPTNVAPLLERWTTNLAVQNWKSRATPRVIEPPTTPRPNRQGCMAAQARRH
jgi:hypothetical protein